MMKATMLLIAARVVLERADCALTESPRHHHPGVRSHLTAARMQLDTAIRLADPANDQLEAA